MRSALEEDNDRMVAELERKVAALKGATQSIHDEVSEQNRMLGGMVRACGRVGGRGSGAGACGAVRRRAVTSLGPAAEWLRCGRRPRASRGRRWLEPAGVYPARNLRAAARHSTGALAERGARGAERGAPAAAAWQRSPLLLPATHSPLTPPPTPPALQSDDFDRTGGLLGGTLQRLDGLVKAAGGSPHMCRLILLVVLVFLLLYWLLGKR